MKIDASESTILAVSAALGRAALFDDRMTADDKHRIAVWAEALDPFGIDQATMLNAVTAFYREPRDRSITVGDLTRTSRDIRQAEVLAESPAELKERNLRNDIKNGLERPHALTGPDRQLGGLEIGGADGVPVPKAYEVNGAVERPCPTCGAEDYAPCVNRVNGSPRKMPCLARLKSAPVSSDGDARLSDSLRWFRKTSNYTRADEPRFEELVRSGLSKYDAVKQIWPKHIPGGLQQDRPTEAESRAKAAETRSA